MLQFFALATLLITEFVSLDLVDGAARECYFGPPPQPDPDNPDPNHWMKRAMADIRKNCPGRRRPQPAPEPQRKLACEYSSLSISCGRSELIDVKWALYGREEGVTVCQWGPLVPCGNATSTLPLVKQHCQGKLLCKFTPSFNAIFGDPCMGIGKYLVIHYNCVAL